MRVWKPGRPKTIALRPQSVHPKPGQLQYASENALWHYKIAALELKS
jgi:hypothetical protein